MAESTTSVAKSTDPSPLLLPVEAAKILGVRASTLAKWATAGRLTVVRTAGGHRRYMADEVRDLYHRGESAP